MVGDNLNRRFKALLMAACFGIAAVAAGATAFGVSAYAQSFSEVAKPEVPVDVNSFPLDEAFLTRMEAAQHQLNTMDMTSDTSSEDQGAAVDHTPAALAAQIDKQPKVKAALAKHGLTPHDYILGYFALVSSLSAAEAENEEQLVDELSGINPAHIAFGKQFQDRISKLLGE